MYLLPPTRNIRAYVKGERKDAPSNKYIAKRDFGRFVGMYDEVTARCSRTCEGCGKPYLAAPHLRLVVVDPLGDWLSPDNIRVLCTTCNSRRERDAVMNRLSVEASFVNEVADREGRRCVYCLAGPLYGVRADIAAVVDKPDPTDQNDWACSCKTCLRERGPSGHLAFVKEKRDELKDTYHYLRELAESLEDM